ncbi:hypothetical protein CHH57_06765 [Niallia circulans]|uniref:DUF4230 domain-containing protein n=1 Tax=Niallia circulans TaxID=1397 RepID=A0AA91TUX4_NIACI|nr:DUF4230 domain-containing protein [Niallia circulans]PAD84001.1 hypothetical protein CHH57_06765 [Niallia circulans]
MVSKKEKERINRELSAGKREQASTAMELNNRRGIRFPFFGLYRLRNRLNKKIMLFLSVLIILLIAGIVGLWKVAFPKESVLKTTAYLEQMKDLSTLATSQAFVKTILEKEDNEIFGKEIETDFPGTKRKILLVVPGTLTAGVNLSRVTENQLKVNEDEKSIHIELPKADFLQDPSIDFDNVETYSVAGIFRGDVKWEEAYSLMDEAKETMKEEAVDQGILVKAEENAQKTLKEFYGRLGYTLEVSFAGE